LIKGRKIVNLALDLLHFTPELARDSRQFRLDSYRPGYRSPLCCWRLVHLLPSFSCLRALRCQLLLCFATSSCASLVCSAPVQCSGRLILSRQQSSRQIFIFARTSALRRAHFVRTIVYDVTVQSPKVQQCRRLGDDLTRRTKAIPQS